MERLKGVNKLKKVEFKIIQHKVIEWKCPNCQKINQKTVYAQIDNPALECRYCGKIYKGWLEGDH